MTIITIYSRIWSILFQLHLCVRVGTLSTERVKERVDFLGKTEKIKAKLIPWQKKYKGVFIQAAK